MSQGGYNKLQLFLAKIFCVDLNYRDPTGALTRGESAYSVPSADSYIEDEPSVKDWLRETAPGKKDAIRFVSRIFPFVHWLPRYNLQWLIGDLIAGITVGTVVVPQGMSYSKLAELPVQFGLYASFMGVLIYWLFATSKDITIGVSLFREHQFCVR